MYGVTPCTLSRPARENSPSLIKIPAKHATSELLGAVSKQKPGSAHSLAAQLKNILDAYPFSAKAKGG